MVALFLFAFLGNEMVRLLARVAAGKLALGDILPIIGILIPQCMGFLLPIALFFAILLVYGRLYADSEMTVLQACGLSRMRLLSMTLGVAVAVAIATAAIVMVLNPRLAQEKYQLLVKRGPAIVMQTMAPGHFQALDDKHHVVIYAQGKNHHNGNLQDVFLAQEDPKAPGNWRILTAHEAYLQHQNGHNTVQVRDGVLHTNVAGTATYRAGQFSALELSLPERAIDISHKRQVQTMAQLWQQHQQPLYAAELHWRLAFPLMAIILALLAIPLARVNPRQGRFARVIPAIFIMIIYASMLMIGRGWLRHEVIPTSLGLWWLHGAMIMLTIILYSQSALTARWRHWRWRVA